MTERTDKNDITYHMVHKPVDIGIYRISDDSHVMSGVGVLDRILTSVPDNLRAVWLSADAGEPSLKWSSDEFYALITWDDEL